MADPVSTLDISRLDFVQLQSSSLNFNYDSSSQKHPSLIDLNSQIPEPQSNEEQVDWNLKICGSFIKPKSLTLFADQIVDDNIT